MCCCFGCPKLEAQFGSSKTKLLGKLQNRASRSFVLELLKTLTYLKTLKKVEAPKQSCQLCFEASKMSFQKLSFSEVQGLDRSRARDKDESLDSQLLDCAGWESTKLEAPVAPNKDNEEGKL